MSLRASLRDATTPVAKSIALPLLARAPENAADRLLAWGARQPTRRRTAGTVLANYLLRAAPREVQCQLPTGGFVRGISDDIVIRYLYVFGTWEPGITRVVRGRLSPGDTFIDVGANLGYYSSLGLSSVGPAGEVLAIEPHPDFVEGIRILRSQHPSGSALRLSEVALSDKSGEAQFYLPPPTNQGHGSLHHHESSTARSIIVQTTTLDSLLEEEHIDPKSIGAIKVDVEGAEIEVLLGARNTLTTMRSGAAVLLESATAEGEGAIREIMASHGYRAQSVENEYSPLWYAHWVIRGDAPQESESDREAWPRDLVFTKG